MYRGYVQVAQPTLLACASCFPDEELSQMPLYVAHVTGPCELGTVRQYVLLLAYPIRSADSARALGHGSVLETHMHPNDTVSRPHMPLALGMETRDHDQCACNSAPRHTVVLVVHLGRLAAAPVATGRPIYVLSRLSGPPIGVQMP